MQYARPLPGLGILRHPRPTSFEAAVLDPVFCLVLQGRKETVLGGDAYPMGVGEALLVSHDLPVLARVTKAPYVVLLFDVSLATLREQLDAPAGPVSTAATAAPAATEARSIGVHRAEARLADALRRYLELADSPADAAVLGPLVSREVHYRLATAPFGGMLRELVRKDSAPSAIARALAELRSDFRTPVEVPKLARRVGMSASAFHKHFKAITASSPLQYKKSLQLLEARRLLRLGAQSVTAVAFDVGYESAAQFSRDYSRAFGNAPKHDVPVGARARA